MMLRILSLVNNCMSSLLGCSLDRWLCHKKAVSGEASLDGRASFVQPVSWGVIGLFQVRTVIPVGLKFRNQQGLQDGHEEQLISAYGSSSESITWDFLTSDCHAGRPLVGPKLQEALFALIALGLGF